MELTKKIIILVNAFSAGRYLPFYVTAWGFPCVHVITNDNFSGCQKIPFDSYAEVIHLQENSVVEMDKIAQQLKKYDLLAVMPGEEGAVITAEYLAQKLGVTSNNNYDSYLKRRHKFYMIEALADAGLATQKQILIHDLNELLQWYKDSQLKEIILKPSLSALSNYVFYCNNSEEIEKNFKKMYGQSDLFGNVIREIVAQEYLEGEEYIVNTVSLQGKHVVSDIWCGIGRKRGKISCDEYAAFITPEQKEFKILSDYVGKVLDALEIKNGPAHSEIRITDKGPYLIETGARLAGGSYPPAITHLLGYNQISLWMKSLVCEDQFKQRLAQQPPSYKRFAKHVYLTRALSGIISRSPDFSEIQKLKSFNYLYFKYQLGDVAVKGVKSGFAYLISNNEKQLEEDYLKFREIEQKIYQTIIESA